MVKVEAKKDGNGNIVISEDSFEMLLSCLDNQKFVGEKPQNGDSLSVGEDEYWKIQGENQKFIDEYNMECRRILHQKIVLRTESDGYFLAKRYEHQNDDSEWVGNDYKLVRELFKDTRIIYEKPENLLPLDGSDTIGKTDGGWMVVDPEPRPWLIERPLRYDYEYITISEDGKRNRPWKQEEIDKILKTLNNRG